MPRPTISAARATPSVPVAAVTTATRPSMGRPVLRAPAAPAGTSADPVHAGRAPGCAGRRRSGSPTGGRSASLWCGVAANSSGSRSIRCIAARSASRSLRRGWEPDRRRPSVPDRPEPSALDRRDQRTVVAAGRRAPPRSARSPTAPAPSRSGGSVAAPDGWGPTAPTNPAWTSTGATARASRFRSPISSAGRPAASSSSNRAPAGLGDRDPRIGGQVGGADRPPGGRLGTPGPSSASRATLGSPEPRKAQGPPGTGTRPRRPGPRRTFAAVVFEARAKRTSRPVARASPRPGPPPGPSRAPVDLLDGEHVRSDPPEGVGQAGRIPGPPRPSGRPWRMLRWPPARRHSRRGDLRLRSDGSCDRGHPQGVAQREDPWP